MALQWQKLWLPLARGLETKSDKRALQPPDLAVCRDVQFDQINGLQTRKPFTPLTASAVSDPRRVVAYGDELLLFTKEALYTWNASASAWVSRGTYLAPLVTERGVFARTNEQTECDRAELDGVVVYAWTDAGAATGVYVAAADKETGAVLLAPTLIATGTSRPRLVAMSASIVLFFCLDATPALKAISIDPANLATSVASMPSVIATGSAFNLYYDVTYDAGRDLVVVVNRRGTTTSYDLHAVAANLTATSGTKARTADGPLAISVSPDGYYQVIRGHGTAIEGDLLNGTTFADVFTAQAIGTADATPVNQIAAAHRSVKDSGVYRCYVWWSSEENVVGNAALRTNWVSTGNTLGAAAFVDGNISIGSRAFDRDGRVFVWLSFSGQSVSGPLGFRAQLQNTYFLYRDDLLLVAKAVSFSAGGFSAAVGHLPGVQSIGDDEYTWCGTARRVIALGGNASGYGARVPREIAVRFDANEARRGVRLGDTFYVAGGQVVQYDGEGIAEVGFHVYPWLFDATDGGSVTPPGKDAGTFSWKVTWRWDNAKGERERSTTATVAQLTLSADHEATFDMPALYTTLKTGTRSNIAVELWGTQKDAPVGAPFYLQTSNDPSSRTPPNCYVENIPGNDDLAFIDDMTDANTAKQEENPENGGILESLCAPSASIIANDQSRIFLAGLAGRPCAVAYSRLRGDGEVASFHDTLTFEVPPTGGAITALAILDETLFVFCEHATWSVPGQGYDNGSGGQNYGPALKASDDVGAVNAESVALMPLGLIFKSAKGWYLLPRGSGIPQYIGAPIAAFDADEVRSVVVSEAQHQVRCLTGSRMLVFDYLIGQWSEWTIGNGLGSCVWQGQHVFLGSDGLVYAEAEDYSVGVNYGLDVETAWIPTDSIINGFGLLRALQFVGEYRSGCRLRARIAYNMNDSDVSGPTWVDDRAIALSPAVAGATLQLQHGPSLKKCSSFKVRLTAVATSSLSPPSGEALRLTGIAMLVGQKMGLGKQLPAGQRE